MGTKRIILLIAVISLLCFVTLEQKRWNLRPYREIQYSHLNTIYIDKINKTVALMDEYDGLRTELLNNRTLPEPKDMRFWELRMELKKEPLQEVYISLGDLRRRTETGFLTK